MILTARLGRWELSYFPPNSFFFWPRHRIVSNFNGERLDSSSLFPGYSASNINKNIGEFQSPGFPSSVRLHTSPSPSRVQLLSAANTAFSHNCPAPQVPSVQSPPLSPSPSPQSPPQPASLAPNYCWPFYDADCYPAATKVIIATESHKQTEPAPASNQLYIPASAQFYILHSVDSSTGWHFTIGRIPRICSRIPNRFVPLRSPMQLKLTPCQPFVQTAQIIRLSYYWFSFEILVQIIDC